MVGSSVAEPEPVIFAGSSLKEPALANVLNYNLKFKYLIRKILYHKEMLSAQYNLICHVISFDKRGVN